LRTLRTYAAFAAAIVAVATILIVTPPIAAAATILETSVPIPVCTILIAIKIARISRGIIIIVHNIYLHPGLIFDLVICPSFYFMAKFFFG
jgi:hypothetical protein